MVKFSISEKEKQFELGYGLYYIYFSGGFSIKNLDLLYIQLIDSKTSEVITLKEKFLKARDFIDGEKVICCYEFQLNNFSLYNLKIKNPEILVIKNSMLLSVNFITNLFLKPDFTWENINVIIK